MFLIAKIVRGRRLLHQLEQEVEKEKAQKEREKMMATKAGTIGGAGAASGSATVERKWSQIGGSTIASAAGERSSRQQQQQQTRQNSQQTMEESGGGGGAAGGGGGTRNGAECTEMPMKGAEQHHHHHHHPFSACPSSSSAVSAGGVKSTSGFGAGGSVELDEMGTTSGGCLVDQEESQHKLPMNKMVDAHRRRQRAVRQRTDSSLPSADEELLASAADGKHNAKMRRTSSMPSVVESDSHLQFVHSKKGAAVIYRPIKHYNYEDRLSKLQKRALRFTWQRLQTRNGGKRIEAVFEEVFDRMMRSLPVMREMFNTRTFISAMSRCEIATPRDHARLIVKMFEIAIKNLEVEERKRTDTASEFDPNLLGRAHGTLRPYGFTSALWEAFGEAVIDVVLNQEAVRDLPGASQAWVVLTACLVDQLRAGFESSKECPFQRAQTVTMNGTGGTAAAPMDGTNRQQQQLCRVTSAKSNKTVVENEEEERAAGRDNEGFLDVLNNTTENRRNTIASCSDSAYTDEEEKPNSSKTMVMPKVDVEQQQQQRRMDNNSVVGTTTTTTTTMTARRRALSTNRKRGEQRCFSVVAAKTSVPHKMAEMHIMHDMASTEL